MEKTKFYEELLGLSDLAILWVEQSKGKIMLHSQLTIASCVCPECGEKTSMVNQHAATRQVRDLDISGKEVWLSLHIRQFICYPCNRYFNECPVWTKPRRTYTNRQAKWVFELCAKQPFTQVGAQINMNAKTVERLFYEQAKKQLNLSSRYQQVRKLGIDEIAHCKGKKDFVCVLTDLERGIQLDILPDRKKETLQAHFQGLGKQFCEQIEEVCSDIWRPYITVAKACFPNATIVIDRFHVVKALNSVLDDLRKDLRRDYKDEDCFKKIKWTLFKRPEKCNLTDSDKLQSAFDQSSLLKEVYDLRNTFNDLFDSAQNAKWLSQKLDVWVEQAKNIKHPSLKRFLKTLQNWKTEIAAFAYSGLTNAATEGLNNYLRYFKRLSFGLPNFEHMRIRTLLAAV